MDIHALEQKIVPVLSSGLYGDKFVFSSGCEYLFQLYLKHFEIMDQEYCKKELREAHFLRPGRHSSNKLIQSCQVGVVWPSESFLSRVFVYLNSSVSRLATEKNFYSVFIKWETPQALMFT